MNERIVLLLFSPCSSSSSASSYRESRRYLNSTFFRARAHTQRSNVSHLGVAKAANFMTSMRQEAGHRQKMSTIRPLSFFYNYLLTITCSTSLLLTLCLINNVVFIVARPQYTTPDYNEVTVGPYYSDADYERKEVRYNCSAAMIGASISSLTCYPLIRWLYFFERNAQNLPIFVRDSSSRYAHCCVTVTVINGQYIQLVPDVVSQISTCFAKLVLQI